MAKAQRNLLVNFQSPLKGWDTGWARADQRSLTTPDVQNVLPFDLDRRGRISKRPGFSILTGGSIGVIALTYRQAQKCSDDSFAGLYLLTTSIGAYPYTFSRSGVCYYVAETTTTETPAGTILSVGALTSYADCTACAAAVSPPPPPPPPTTYRQVRRCTDDTLASFWIADAGLSFPAHVLRTTDDNCYYVLEADPSTTIHGTLIGTTSPYATCELCDDARGGGGSAYYQAYTCANSPVDCWILASSISTPYFFFRFDHLDEPVVITGAHETSTSPGTVYAVPDDVIEVGSCTQTGGCWEDSFPSNTIITFSGVTVQTSCRATDGVPLLESWRATGTINGSYNLVKESESPTRVVYKLAIGIHVLGYAREASCGPNTNCSTATIDGCAAVVYDGDMFQIRLEVDVMFGTPTGFRVMIGPSPLGVFDDTAGPLGFTGSQAVVDCRETKTIPNEITSRYMGQASSAVSGSPSTDFFASGGHVVVTLGF